MRSTRVFLLTANRILVKGVIMKTLISSTLCLMFCFTAPLCFGDTEKGKVSKELQNAKELRNAIYYGANSKVVVDLDKIKLLLEKGEPQLDRPRVAGITIYHKSLEH